MAGPDPSPGPVETTLLAELAPGFTARFTHAGGARLRYLEGGSGPAAVLVHGRGNAASMWLPVLTALARHHRVLAVDLPGFGLSTTPPDEPATAEDALAFFARPVEALLESLDLGPVAVVGHSLGAMVGVELALRSRVSVERLALIGPMGVGPSMTLGSRVFFRLGPERVARFLEQKGYARLFPPPKHPLGPRLAALDYELLTAPGGRVPASRAFNRLFPLFGPAFHLGDSLGQVKAPTLILWGQRDEVFPVAAAPEVAARFRDARLLTPPLRHSPHLERPDEVLPLLSDFLRS